FGTVCNLSQLEMIHLESTNVHLDSFRQLKQIKSLEVVSVIAPNPTLEWLQFLFSDAKVSTVSMRMRKFMDAEFDLITSGSRWNSLLIYTESKTIDPFADSAGNQSWIFPAPTDIERKLQLSNEFVFVNGNIAD
ncbi:MAG: hypothetical protein ACI9HK_005458, partial [Pirellulaceae bacterium]